MLKHTPTPWEASTGLTVAFNNLADQIAMQCGDGTWGQLVANYRLVRHAGELYEALKDCIESLQRLPNVEGAYRITCLEQARKVIAKVEEHV